MFIKHNTTNCTDVVTGFSSIMRSIGFKYFVLKVVSETTLVLVPAYLSREYCSCPGPSLGRHAWRSAQIVEVFILQYFGMFDSQVIHLGGGYGSDFCKPGRASVTNAKRYRHLSQYSLR